MWDVIIPSSLAHFISSLSPLCPCLMSAPDWPLSSLCGTWESSLLSAKHWDLLEVRASANLNKLSTCNEQFHLEQKYQVIEGGELWVISLSTVASLSVQWRLKVAKTRMMGQWQQLSPSVVHAPLIPGLLVAPAYWSNETIRWPDIIQTQPWSKKPSLV